MTETDQCIVCLEDLPGGPSIGNTSALSLAPTPPEISATIFTADHLAAAQIPAAASPSATVVPDPTLDSEHIAIIEACGHTLHNHCLQSWITKANTCPICRKTFYKVTVLNRIGGNRIDTYSVEDKKQTIEFDPTWLLAIEEDREEYGDDLVIDDNDEEEDSDDDGALYGNVPAAELYPSPCTTCPLSEFANSDVLNCQMCGRGFHKDCVSIEDDHPLGDNWICTDCDNRYERRIQNWSARQSNSTRRAPRSRRNYDRDLHSRPLLRAPSILRSHRRSSQRRGWHGFWPQGPLSEISSMVFERLNIEIEYPPDEDLERYRRIQRLEDRFRQRADIAARAGRPADIRQYSATSHVEAKPQDPEEARQRQDESMSWSALATACLVDEQVSPCTDPSNSGSRSRPRNNQGQITGSLKRKASADESTLSPSQHQPERKLKRPRTKRLPEAPEVNPALAEASSDKGKTIASPPALSIRPKTGDQPVRPMKRTVRQVSPPSFLTSLLEEIEQNPVTPASKSSPLDRPGNIRTDFSPANSPPPSDWGSPMSRRSPPPFPLSSHVAPVFPRANYRPPRPTTSRQQSDEEVRSQRVKHKERTEEVVAHAIAKGANA